MIKVLGLAAFDREGHVERSLFRWYISVRVSCKTFYLWRGIHIGILFSRTIIAVINNRVQVSVSMLLMPMHRFTYLCKEYVLKIIGNMSGIH